MNKTVYYKKQKTVNARAIARRIGLVMIIIGTVGLLYITFPLLSWQFYFSAFASEGVISPIPQTSTPTNMATLLSTSGKEFIGVDYNNAENWFPTMQPTQQSARVTSYTISIPKIDVQNAVVATNDLDLSKHMVQYNSNATPPEKGTAMIFGHSTLPQLYDPKNYKTILAKAYMLQKGDSIIATVDGVAYMYKIFNIRIIDPEDTSIFSKTKDDSYLTIVTCTPPGTIWKRLVLQAKLQAL